MNDSLIQPLFDGPLDIVGDIHGEIDTLHSLMRHLEYDEDGSHADGRRLIFVGDLTDRGPDSPAAVNLVQRLIQSGRAQCVLRPDRDELLDREIFDTLLEAKVLIERWRVEYNTVRPHSSLGYRAPAPETMLPLTACSATLHKQLKENPKNVS